MKVVLLISYSSMKKKIGNDSDDFRHRKLTLKVRISRSSPPDLPKTFYSELGFEGQVAKKNLNDIYYVCMPLFLDEFILLQFLNPLF